MKGLSLIAFVLWAGAVAANVDLRTGNFYTTFTDVLFDESYDLKVLRVYNSQTDYNGMFGHGWCSNLETRLKVLSDDRILIVDFGGGSKTWFKADRNQKGGDIFESDQYGYEVLTKTNEGFKRLTHDGAYEYFNQQGYLIELISKERDQIIQLVYTSDSKLSKVSDNFQHTLLFSYNELGLVQSITGAGNKSANYRYSSSGTDVLLTGSEDVGNNRFEFQYNEGNKLTSIQYADGSMKTIHYDGNDRVLKDTERNGNYTLYTYKGDSNSDTELHLEREATTYDTNNKLLRSVSKEFKFRRDENNHLLLTFYRDNSRGRNSSMKIKLKTTGSPLEYFESIFKM